MFISIPKEFFVPVIFGDGYTLNLENMEFDTERNRVENQSAAQSKKDKDNPGPASPGPMSPFTSGDLYAVLDEEYVNSAIGMK